MGEILKFEVRGYRDVRGRFARRTPELHRARREELRRLARGMAGSLRHYAPGKTGVFREGIGFRTDDRGSQTTATFFVRGEHAFLLNILTGGSIPHLIPRGGSAEQLAKGYPLHWVDQATGEHRFAWSVWHPGTFPDPFVERAVDSQSPQFAMFLTRTARQVVWL